MKTHILATALILMTILTPSSAQDCAHDSTGLIPINDLGTSLWRGYKGGLYPNGSNILPASHRDNALMAASGIQPRDAAGNISAGGSIVLLAIGASNPRTEFANVQMRADTFAKRNPVLRILNGCIGGQGIQKILQPSSNYWSQQVKFLDSIGCTAKQVQIVWVEIDNTQNPDTMFPRSSLDSKTEFKILAQKIKSEYPNCVLMYVTGRAYSGYVPKDTSSNGPGRGLLFPRDYLNGWSLKWLIEDQINGDDSLKFAGTGAKAPLIMWSTYLWADGSHPRTDGLRWECPNDFGGDGLHLSPSGEAKAGVLLFDFFRLDPVAGTWFLKPGTSVVKDIPDGLPSEMSLSVLQQR